MILCARGIIEGIEMSERMPTRNDLISDAAPRPWFSVSADCLVSNSYAEKLLLRV